MKKIDPKSIKRLLIRSTNWIGDAIMTTPCITAIRNNFPDARIYLLTKPWVAPVFEHSTYFDHLVIYDSDEKHKGIGGKIRLAKDLRPYRFDAANLFVARQDYGVRAIKRLGRHIFQVSVQSIKEAKDKTAKGVMEERGFYYKRCLIGDEGGIDFYKVFLGLKAIGFDGYVTVIEPISDVMDNKELARYTYEKVKGLLVKAGYSIP